MRIVVSIGGSILAPDLDPDGVRGHASVIDQLVAKGHEIAVVVGGGSVARDYISVARDLGATEYDLDAIGIAVTRLNARLLLSALTATSATEPAQTHTEARKSLRRGEVAVMGGTVPGHTTDAVSALLAEMVSADLLIFATSVAGVYSADPNSDPSAERFEELTASELVEVISSIEASAGSKAPVDLLAAKIIERSGIQSVVLDGTTPQSIAAAVDDSFDGTVVRPTGHESPATEAIQDE